jgi:hypothetical protein
LAPVVVVPTTFKPIRINVGSMNPILDKSNQTWIDDTTLQYHLKDAVLYDTCADGIATPMSFVSSSNSSNPITNNIDTSSGLICSERYFCWKTRGETGHGRRQLRTGGT